MITLSACSCSDMLPRYLYSPHDHIVCVNVLNSRQVSLVTTALNYQFHHLFHYRWPMSRSRLVIRGILTVMTTQHIFQGEPVISTNYHASAPVINSLGWKYSMKGRMWYIKSSCRVISGFFSIQMCLTLSSIIFHSSNISAE